MTTVNTYNTGVYKEEWETKLQERLDYPITWKEVADVKFSLSKIINWPYMSTVPSVQAGTRGCAYGYAQFALTNDYVDIATKYVSPQFIDRADLAQCSFANQMTIAELQGQLLNEQIESAMLADYAAWTDFDNSAIGGSAGNITVSANNIDKIIRAVKRKVGEANGQSLFDRNDGFVIWRYKDLESLEQFAQANGFNLADKALKEGIKSGYYFMDMFHYVSNKHSSNHIMAGVKKLYRIGILSATYGQVTINQDPAATSGIGIVARVDYGVQTPVNYASLLFDVQCAA